MKIEIKIYYDDKPLPGVTLKQVISSQRELDRLANEFDFLPPDIETLGYVFDEKTGRRIIFERTD